LSMGFRVSVSLHPAIQATGRLTFAPAGLIPAEHTSLRWTHRRTQICRQTAIEGSTMRTIIAIALAALMASPAFADGLACDVVHERLDKASSVLGLDISIVLIPWKHLQLTTHDDPWGDKVSGPDGKAYSVEVHCLYNKFSLLVMDMSPADGPTQPKTDMVAAAIYAVTGWPPTRSRRPPPT
jgi:hypothetical protein